MTRFVFALLLFPAVASAQPPGLEGAPDPQAHIERISEKLGLDDGQTAAIEAILTSAHEEGRVLREEGRSLVEDLRDARESGDPKALKSALKAVDAFQAELHQTREETQDAIRAELTLEQQALFVEMELRRNARPHGPPRRERGQQRPDL